MGVKKAGQMADAKAVQTGILMVDYSDDRLVGHSVGYLVEKKVGSKDGMTAGLWDATDVY